MMRSQDRDKLSGFASLSILHANALLFSKQFHKIMVMQMSQSENHRFGIVIRIF